MDRLIEKYQSKLASTSTAFVRSVMDDINWNARLIGIKGARGVGKTTLLLQRLKLTNNHQANKALYVSLDNLWFSENKLSHLVDYFVKRGGQFLFLDEVHKYNNWSLELKNIYDDYPDLSIVFTGSSLLEILNARADLSRRAIVYNMQGLSFREFLNLKYRIDIRVCSLDEILREHTSITHSIINKIKPLQYFDEYLKSGYYPFFLEEESLYHMRLEEVINLILEIEFPQLRGVNIANIGKLKQLMQIISQSAPFIPNISKLSERIGINRETLLTYLNHMDQAHLIFSAYKSGKGITQLQKPDKLFLENTNIMYALAGEQPNAGNVRETFFANQLRYQHQVALSEKTDFIINKTISFEIGGQNKTNRQLKNIDNAYVAADDIEYGFDNKIPLWQFGLLY